MKLNKVLCFIKSTWNSALSFVSPSWSEHNKTCILWSGKALRPHELVCINEQRWHYYNRPSDRVRGCGTAQFGQTHTITHNSQNPAKSRTILKDLLKHLIKSGLLLITKIPKNFLNYFQTIYLPKQSRNPLLSSITRADIKRVLSSLCTAWALVSVRSTFGQLQ